ncbi:uncharacterized protein DEA37_0012723, partial [Paragonimus westermani]
MSFLSARVLFRPFLNQVARFHRLPCCLPDPFKLPVSCRTYSHGPPMTKPMIEDRVMLVLRLYDKVNPEKTIMSSQSEEEADGLPFDIDEVMSAKRNNPGLFVSAWEADENDVELWSKAQIRADPIKRFIVSAEEGNLATLQEIVTRAQKHVPGSPHPSVAELLSAKDADGYSALHRAAYGGHVRTVEV